LPIHSQTSLSQKIPSQWTKPHCSPTTPTDRFDDDDDDDGGFAAAGNGMEGDPPPEEDFFVGDQGIDDDYGGGDGMSHDNFGAEDGEQGSVGAQAGQAVMVGTGAFVPFDPRRMPNERDLVMAMTDADAEGGMMDYFDQNFLKNWAGPEHWKLRKVVRNVNFLCYLLDLH